jgi:hypothetical protein
MASPREKFSGSTITTAPCGDSHGRVRRERARRGRTPGASAGGLDFDDDRAAQRAKYGGELFSAQLPEGRSGQRFLEFFQIDRDTGAPKGIVLVPLPDALEEPA